MLSLIQMVCGRPWAIQSAAAHYVEGMLRRGGIGALRELAGLKALIHDRDGIRAAARGGSRAASSVAVIPLIGTMTQRGDVMGSEETVSTDAFAAMVADVVAEPNVASVVLNVDSPGGEVYGLPEAWTVLRAAARQKPMVAVVNTTMASGALYVASAATEILISPSGTVGSLGVYALHMDESKSMEAEGMSAEFVVADDSPHKVEGASNAPLSDDARAQLKKECNRYMAMFVRDVAKGRGVSVDHVREHFGRGRMLSPQDALAVKLVDGIGTLADGIARAAALASGREGEMRQRAELEPSTIQGARARRRYV